MGKLFANGGDPDQTPPVAERDLYSVFGKLNPIIS